MGMLQDFSAKFMMTCMVETQQFCAHTRRKSETMSSLHPWPEERTGPVALWHAYQDYKRALPNSRDLFLLEKEALYPLDWRRFPVGSEPLYIDEQGEIWTVACKIYDLCICDCNPSGKQYPRHSTDLSIIDSFMHEPLHAIIGLASRSKVHLTMMMTCPVLLEVPPPRLVSALPLWCRA